LSADGKASFRTWSDLTGPDRSGLAEQIAAQRARVARRLAEVDRVIGITSGKGGVGKSLVSACVAAALHRQGQRVGVLDADLHGPSAARILDAAAGPLSVAAGSVRPAGTRAGPVVFGTALLLGAGRPLDWRGPDGNAEGFVWRGAEERRALREFLSDVEWGRLDWLVVDLPPGLPRTIDLLELVPDRTGLVAVTIPSRTSADSVERSMAWVRSRGARLLGVVENMSAYACSGCGEERSLFPGDAGAALAEAFGIPLLGRIPFDPRAAERAERGDVAGILDETAAGGALLAVTEAILDRASAATGASTASRAAPKPPTDAGARP
jgi:ATP-binding protein involved in chromosome partitioning